MASKATCLLHGEQDYRFVQKLLYDYITEGYHPKLRIYKVLFRLDDAIISIFIDETILKKLHLKQTDEGINEWQKEVFETAISPKPICNICLKNSDSKKIGGIPIFTGF